MKTYSLKLTTKIINRSEVEESQIELIKAKETIKELMKDKGKYREKILKLSHHIHSLRQNKLKCDQLVELKHKKGIYRYFKIKSIDQLHELVKEHKSGINDVLRHEREERKYIQHFSKPFGNKSIKIFGYPKKGLTGKGTGFVYKKGQILELLKAKKLKLIETPRVPNTTDNHVGVEIEFASFLSQDKIAQLFLDAGLFENVQLHHEYIDGRDPGEKEWELSVIAPENEIYSVIEKVCRVLNEKVDANITRGCGLHVHIDARNRDKRKMFDNLFNCQEILYDMVAYTRRSNKHVQLMSKKQWYPVQNGFLHSRDCKEEKCICTYKKDNAFRFYGLNTWSFKSHNTMEVRIHSGTSNAVKINNWIRILLAIVDGKVVPSYLKSLVDFKRFVKLDGELTEYMEKRIENFKSRDEV